VLDCEVDDAKLPSNAGVPKLTLAMYPFSILIDEHVPLKLLVT